MPAPTAPAPGLGEFIRDRREALGLTAGQLGDRIGVHQTTVSRWERGEHLTTVKNHATALSDILGVEKETIQRLWWDDLGGYLTPNR